MSMPPLTTQCVLLGACHTGGQNIIESEKTLEKESLVEYLDGGVRIFSSHGHLDKLLLTGRTLWQPPADLKSCIC